MPRHRIAVPEPSASLDELWTFAHSYWGYVRHGGVRGLGRLANRQLLAWKSTGALPTTARRARACLFFEARRWRHLSDPVDKETERYVRALVEVVRANSESGTVVDDHQLWWMPLRTRLHNGVGRLTGRR